MTDREVVAFAKQEGRIVVTFDLDFGKIYHQWERGQIGAIVLRLEDQTIETVNRVLFQLFSQVEDTSMLERALVVVDENRIRLTREP